MKTITKAGAFILAGVLLLTAGCGNNEVETQQSPLVKTITVGEKDSENDTTFSGTVHGYYESPLAFQVGGQITNRYVQGQSGTAVVPRRLPGRNGSGGCSKKFSDFCTGIL